MSSSYPPSQRRANRPEPGRRGLQSPLVSDEADVLRAAAAASAQARPGERVVAVLAAAPFLGPPLYLCGLRAEGDEAPLAWLAVDEHGAVVDDERRVREAASLVALCETAEEAAGALGADELQAAAHAALALSGPADARLREALEAVARAAAGLAGRTGGVRVARADYLDAVTASAREL